MNTKPYYIEHMETFILPAGTSVSVALPGGTRFDHTLKNEQRFHNAHRRYDEASDDYYYRFVTDNTRYPHMFVLKSLFETSAIRKSKWFGRSAFPVGAATALPVGSAKAELTKKQIKRMRTKSQCPDCSHEYWAGGPCGGGAQNMRCNGCGSKFNVSPLHIERI